MLLRDYAITPDVFDTTCHSGDEVCGLRLDVLKDVLLTEGMVRDLRGGEWRALLSSEHRSWHRRGKELVKKLATQGRLIEFAPIGAATPADDTAWCSEALATHAALPLTGGIVVTERVKAAFTRESLVGRIDQLPGLAWWAARSPSVRLGRNLSDFEKHLEPVLRCANSIMFIDPHLDPSRPGYSGIGNLIAAAGGRTVRPTIEIHRVCYEGSGSSRDILGPSEIESRFRRGLGAPVQTAGLSVDVFVWDDFHDRYLVSNLIGISVPYGFDTTSNPGAVTTWTRLGRSDRDDVQREFDHATDRHTLRHRFTMG